MHAGRINAHLGQRRRSQRERAQDEHAEARRIVMEELRAKGSSLQEIADRYGISRQRVGQLLGSAR